MKRTILTVLMLVMFATPCFAQEIETDGLFSLHGTQWEVIPLRQRGPDQAKFLSFYQNQIFLCKYFEEECTTESYMKPAFYVDLIGINYFHSGYCLPGFFFPCPWCITYQGLASSLLGTGIMFYHRRDYGLTRGCVSSHTINILKKINDDWTPPGE